MLLFSLRFNDHYFYLTVYAKLFILAELNMIQNHTIQFPVTLTQYDLLRLSMTYSDSAAPVVPE